MKQANIKLKIRLVIEAGIDFENFLWGINWNKSKIRERIPFGRMFVYTFEKHEY